MRKPYRNALASLFGESHLSWSGNGKSHFKRGRNLDICEMWRELDQSTFALIRVRAHPQAESFGIDVGWNSEKCVPEPKIDDERYFDYHGRAKELPSNLVSLPLLVAGNDKNWEIHALDVLLASPELLLKEISQEEAIVDVTASFSDALKMINQHGVPYLESVFRR